MSKDDTMTVSGTLYENVLHIYIHDHHDTKLGPMEDYRDYYYSRDIGLIKYVNSGLSPIEKNLVDYYIAPH